MASAQGARSRRVTIISGHAGIVRVAGGGYVVGLLDRFEQRLDRMVNGAFARAFKAEVQPVEIAAALQREMTDHAAVVSRGLTVVPNVYSVD